VAYTSKKPALDSDRKTDNKIIAPSFYDRRASTAVQLKQQQLMNSFAENAFVIQRKTEVKNTGQSYNYEEGSVTVGKKMEAWLDPNDNQQGQSANLNTSQDDMMDAIRGRWDITGGDVVKGHLLNDNLGGKALNNNLYPITRGANKDHLGYAENAVKARVWKDNLGMYYEVNVQGTPHIDENVAYFDCVFKEWDTTQPGNTSGTTVLGPITVFSNLESVRDTGMVWNTDDSSMDVERTKPPKKPKNIKPKTKVSELNKTERNDRMMDM